MRQLRLGRQRKGARHCLAYVAKDAPRTDYFFQARSGEDQNDERLQSMIRSSTCAVTAAAAAAAAVSAPLPVQIQLLLAALRVVQQVTRV
eukprot:1153024-Pelagomonas_calceolata.AAC.1